MRTVGVEEELLLVDATTGVPTALAGAALARRAYASVPDGDLGAELQQQQLELETAPTADLAELAERLATWRRTADEQARGVGARVVAMGTSPLPVDPELTPKSRYESMAELLGLTADEQLTCGCHVHVDVAGDDEGVAVLDRIRIWLPVLLALSANSPYWQGRDTGYASFRSQAWTRFPGAGPTAPFGSAAAYHERTAAMVGSGTLLDLGMIYFDARLSRQYPTVEVRAADVCLRLEDTVLIAGLARALVESAARDATDGVPVPEVSGDLLRLASWRAGRSGLADDLLDPYTARPRPAAEVIGMLLQHLRPALRDSGDEETVVRALERVSNEGTGASTQRRLAEHTRDLADLTRAAAEITIGARSSTDPRGDGG